ncbi:MAG: hypothetical protein A3E53_01470 [Gammaproteobacteria bacterium RIFCSPHIGHO2_12_FULL_39_24]|nr:MAG: hypothetical protein A3E53_01470 [Gammaproteobacteria bacterium RIFCSPHIGHO2_12_FULL_39_24]
MTVNNRSSKERKKARQRNKAREALAVTPAEQTSPATSQSRSEKYLQYFWYGLQQGVTILMVVAPIFIPAFLRIRSSGVLNNVLRSAAALAVLPVTVSAQTPPPPVTPLAFQDPCLPLTTLDDVSGNIGPFTSNSALLMVGGGNCLTEVDMSLETGPKIGPSLGPTTPVDNNCVAAVTNKAKTLAFTAAEKNNGLIIFDLKTGVKRGELLGFNAGAVALSENEQYAYVVAEGTSIGPRILAIDVSDPSNPTLSKTLQLKWLYTGNDAASRFYLLRHGNKLVVAYSGLPPAATGSYCDATVCVVDASNTTGLVLEGSVSWPFSPGNPAAISNMALSDDGKKVTISVENIIPTVNSHEFKSGVYLIDISDPGNLPTKPPQYISGTTDAVLFSPGTSKKILAGDANGLTSLNSGQLISTDPLTKIAQSAVPGGIKHFSRTPDDRFLVIQTQDQKLIVAPMPPTYVMVQPNSLLAVPEFFNHADVELATGVGKNNRGRLFFFKSGVNTSAGLTPITPTISKVEMVDGQTTNDASWFKIVDPAKNQFEATLPKNTVVGKDLTLRFHTDTSQSVDVKFDVVPGLTLEPNTVTPSRTLPTPTPNPTTPESPPPTTTKLPTTKTPITTALATQTTQAPPDATLIAPGQTFHAPTWVNATHNTYPAQTVPLGESIVLKPVGNAVDPDGDVLTVKSVTVNGDPFDGSVINNAFRVSCSEEGPQTVSVVVGDGRLNSQPAQFPIQCSYLEPTFDADRLPTVLPFQSRKGGSYRLPFNAFTGTGDLRISAKLQDGTVVLAQSVVSPGLELTMPPRNLGVVDTITLTLIDEYDKSAEFNITAKAIDHPLVVGNTTTFPAKITALANKVTTVVFPADLVTGGNSLIQYSITPALQWVQLSQDNGVYRVTITPPKGEAVGEDFNFALMATDESLTTQIAFQVSIPAHQPPILTKALADQVALTSEENNFPPLDIFFKSPDDYPLTYRVEQLDAEGRSIGLSAPWSFDSKTNKLFGKPDIDHVGDVQFRVIAIDALGGEKETTFKTTVKLSPLDSLKYWGLRVGVPLGSAFTAAGAFLWVHENWSHLANFTRFGRYRKQFETIFEFDSPSGKFHRKESDTFAAHNIQCEFWIEKNTFISKFASLFKPVNWYMYQYFKLEKIDTIDWVGCPQESYNPNFTVDLLKMESAKKQGRLIDIVARVVEVGTGRILEECVVKVNIEKYKKCMDDYLASVPPPPLSSTAQPTEQKPIHSGKKKKRHHSRHRRTESSTSHSGEELLVVPANPLNSEKGSSSSNGLFAEQESSSDSSMTGNGVSFFSSQKPGYVYDFKTGQCLGSAKGLNGNDLAHSLLQPPEKNIN